MARKRDRGGGRSRGKWMKGEEVKKREREKKSKKCLARWRTGLPSHRRWVINNVSRDGPRTLASGTIHQLRLARERSDNDSARRERVDRLPERHAVRRIRPSRDAISRRSFSARSFGAAPPIAGDANWLGRRDVKIAPSQRRCVPVAYPGWMMTITSPPLLCWKISLRSQSPRDPPPRSQAALRRRIARPLWNFNRSSSPTKSILQTAFNWKRQNRSFYSEIVRWWIHISDHPENFSISRISVFSSRIVYLRYTFNMHMFQKFLEHFHFFFHSVWWIFDVRVTGRAGESRIVSPTRFIVKKIRTMLYNGANDRNVEKTTIPRWRNHPPVTVLSSIGDRYRHVAQDYPCAPLT